MENGISYSRRGMQLFRIDFENGDKWINSNTHEKWNPVLFDEGPHPSFCLDEPLTEQQALAIALEWGMAEEAFYAE